MIGNIYGVNIIILSTFFIIIFFIWMHVCYVLVMTLSKMLVNGLT